MFRLRIAGVLAVVALLAAACGDDGGEAVAPDEPQGQAETPEADASESDGSSGADGIDESDVGEGSDAGESAAGAEEPDEAGAAEESEPAAAAEAEALLASAAQALDGSSARGEAVFDFVPGFSLSSTFESDADGDVVARIELPPGFDPQFLTDLDTELRYVGGVVYARPPVSAETLAELGLDEAWYVVEPLAASDPMGAAASAGGVMCVLPQSPDAYIEDCDPLGAVRALLEAAGEAEIIGREDVLGAEAARVRFQVSLLDLAGGALGLGTDEDGAESSDGVFDDSSPDLFEGVFEEMFGFLGAGLEMEAWIGDDSLVRRLAFDPASMLAGLVGPDEEIPATPVTIEFFDFGADISVDAPPPETIVDDPSLLGRGDGYDPVADIEPYDDTSG